MQLQKKIIQAKAKNLGFSFVGFSPVKQTPHFKEYEKWVKDGMAGNMHYLAKSHIIENRRNPQLLLKEGQTVIVLGINYNLKDKIEIVHKSNYPGYVQIAAYAHHPDYHDNLKKKCGDLITFLINLKNITKHTSKMFVDSAPVMEKDFAFQAGLGSIGKNSLFLHPEFGSNCHLACIFTDLCIEPDDQRQDDFCGNCRLCIDACPTGAINNNRTIDARKCISYLTIEHKGIIPEAYRKKMGNWVFGCDTCQEVCPLNRDTHENITKEKTKTIDLFIDGLTVERLLRLNHHEYVNLFNKTPIRRTIYEQFLRNVIVAAGNSPRKVYEHILCELLLNHPSSLVRAHAAWAAGHYDSLMSKQTLQKVYKTEQDGLVRFEIDRVLFK